jgi:Ser/Thr protein kinase RdoA (MazF antagonist)
MKKTLPAILGDLDSKIFDIRNFNVRPSVISDLCKNFRLGRLKDYCVEKDIKVSHSNFVVFLSAGKGKFVLKFYPTHANKAILKEFVLNKFLIKNGGKTPAMLAANNDSAFVKEGGYLVTCYEFARGRPIYLAGLNRPMIRKVLRFIHSFNGLLDCLNADKRFHHIIDREDYPTKIHFLHVMSRACGDSSEKGYVHGILKKIGIHYAQNLSAYTQKLIHCNLSLANILYDGRFLHMLDLSHIRHDYALNDLAYFYVSFCFFNGSREKIDTAVAEYFEDRKASEQKKSVFYNFVLLNFVKEYLKVLQKENNIYFCKNSLKNVAKFAHELLKRKNTIRQTIDAIAPRL